jgi:hypothetical protein
MSVTYITTLSYIIFDWFLCLVSHLFTEMFKKKTLIFINAKIHYKLKLTKIWIVLHVPYSVFFSVKLYNFGPICIEITLLTGWHTILGYESRGTLSWKNTVHQFKRWIVLHVPYSVFFSVKLYNFDKKISMPYWLGCVRNRQVFAL